MLISSGVEAMATVMFGSGVDMEYMVAKDL